MAEDGVQSHPASTEEDSENAQSLLIPAVQVRCSSWTLWGSLVVLLLGGAAYSMRLFIVELL